MKRCLFRIVVALLAFVAVSFAQVNAQSSIYLIGEVDGNSWSYDYGVELVEIETDIYYGKYSVEGWFGIVTQFSIDWDTLNNNYRYGAATNGEVIVVGGSNTFIKGDNAFQVSTAGTYEIFVDMSSYTISLSEVAMLDLSITPSSGTVAIGTEVTMECSTAGASIYYTLDGTTPSATSTKYTAPVVLPDGVVTLKAIAISGESSSNVVTATYLVTDTETDAITVSFEKPSNWTSVYLWAWTDAGNVFTSEWPGEVLTDADGDGWYQYTFDSSIQSVNIILNSGLDGEQSADMMGITASTAYTWYADGESLLIAAGGSVPEVNNYLLNATGATACYDTEGEVHYPVIGDDLYGQDANYLCGATMNFTDNGDGSITDNNTGLVWEQVPSTTSRSWSDAVDYCNNLVLAGYDDWRIPTLKELFSISNFEEGWPYLDTNYFGTVFGGVDKREQYWAEEVYVGITVEGGSIGAASFGVNHGTGHIKAYPGISDKYVRAVRGGNYGINEFVDNGDETISDTATGLMWSKYDNAYYDGTASNGGGILWTNALLYAENSELAGYDDWRLPNIKELQSIVDYTKSITATQGSDTYGAAIDDKFYCSPYTSEAGYDDFGYYWSSTSARFSSDLPMYFAWYAAFGRSVNDEGEDYHGAGAVRFDSKALEVGGIQGDEERYYNFVRLVRDDSSTSSVDAVLTNSDECSVEAYPNPVTDIVSVKYAEGIDAVEILDIAGKLVGVVSGSGQTEIAIDLSTMANGLYMIRVNGADVVKIIKK